MPAHAGAGWTQALGDAFSALRQQPARTGTGRERTMRWCASVAVCALVGLTQNTALAASVRATVASGNPYAVYTGNADGTEIELVGSYGVTTQAPRALES